MTIALSNSMILADDLNTRIRESESVDIVVSFIKQSGLILLIGSLYQFTEHGNLRVITTAYIGSTKYATPDESHLSPQHGGAHGA